MSTNPSPSESGNPPRPLSGEISGHPSSSWNWLYFSRMVGHKSR